MKAFPCEYQEYDPDYVYMAIGTTVNDVTPVEECKGKWVTKQSTGMDLRDYFASKAMEGLISSTSALEGEALVARAYVYADLMMKAREVK